jgi:ribonuclease HII
LKGTIVHNGELSQKKAGPGSAFLILPDFSIEKELLLEGCGVIAGIDEAGRGALAGPLCVGMVIYDRSFIASLEGALPGINDSKKLDHRRRLKALETIRGKALLHSSLLVSHRLIDRLNINGATEYAINKLLARAPVRPDIVILDGKFNFDAPVPIRSIIKGDQKSISIASASIVAKVRRDGILDRFDALYPGYHFARNKGYGTGGHMRAIDESGITPVHRKSYEPVKSRLTGGIPL